MNDVAQFERGTALTFRQANEGEIPVVGNSPSPIYYNDLANRHGENIVMARSGAYAGFVSYWDEPFFLTDAFSLRVDPHTAMTRYVYFLLKSQQNNLLDMKKGGGVPHVRVSEIQRKIIPVPPLSEQRRIVSILDRFDSLVNDLSSGLPAEIEARRKQYEYYRDRLLTFRERGNA